MEPQQLSPGGAGTAAATEASSTNGGTMGITVTEPDTSTMQKQAAGLSSLFPSYATEVKICYNRCGKVQTRLQYARFPNVFLAILCTSLALVFVYC
jgi:hypothetical protein